MATLQERQQSTYDEMCKCLDEHGMCCVVRPTGFGKTKLFMDYVSSAPTDKFLYIYDTNSAMADIQAKYNPTNVEFLSYSAISREKSRDSVMWKLCGSAWNTIIFDEAHLMGGQNIKKVLDNVIPLACQFGVRILGGTATKLRTDMLDVSHHFFKDCGVYEYTLLDAIEDGIMQEPVWTVTAHYKELLDSLHKKVGKDANVYVKQQLSQLDKAYAEIDGVSTVYRNAVKQAYVKIPVKMCFIIFYPTVKAIDDNCQRDVQEFQKAFPNHKVVYAKLSSSSEHMDTVVDVERSFEGVVGKQVQLIFAVNMLNQAYHSDKLTGIVMYRSTLSNIIFTQELGRIMSVTAKHSGIVFDNVGNAFIRPEVAMGLSFRGEPGSAHGAREHMDIKVRATEELLKFQEVYKRIEATSKLTQEQIDVARRNWERHKQHMSWEDFHTITGMPRFLIEDESNG